MQLRRVSCAARQARALWKSSVSWSSFDAFETTWCLLPVSYFLSTDTAAPVRSAAFTTCAPRHSAIAGRLVISPRIQARALPRARAPTVADLAAAAVGAFFRSTVTRSQSSLMAAVCCATDQPTQRSGRRASTGHSCPAHRRINLRAASCSWSAGRAPPRQPTCQTSLEIVCSRRKFVPKQPLPMDAWRAARRRGRFIPVASDSGASLRCGSAFKSRAGGSGALQTGATARRPEPRAGKHHLRARVPPAHVLSKYVHVHCWLQLNPPPVPPTLAPPDATVACVLPALPVSRFTRRSVALSITPYEERGRRVFGRTWTGPSVPVAAAAQVLRPRCNAA